MQRRRLVWIQHCLARSLRRAESLLPSAPELHLRIPHSQQIHTCFRQKAPLESSAASLIPLEENRQEILIVHLGMAVPNRLASRSRLLGSSRPFDLMDHQEDQQTETWAVVNMIRALASQELGQLLQLRKMITSVSSCFPAKFMCKTYLRTVTEFGYQPKRRKSLGDLFGGSSTLRTITNRLSLGRSSVLQGIPPKSRMSDEAQTGTIHEGPNLSDCMSQLQDNHWLNHIQDDHCLSPIQQIRPTPTRIPIEVPQMRSTRVMGDIMEDLELSSDPVEGSVNSKLSQQTGRVSV
jgi:hypothetical protein